MENPTKVMGKAVTLDLNIEVLDRRVELLAAAAGTCTCTCCCCCCCIILVEEV